MIDCQNAIGRSAGSFSSIVPLGCRFLQRKSLREDNDDCIRRRLSGAAAAFRWASFPIDLSSMCADSSEMPNKTGSLSGNCTQFIILTFGSFSLICSSIPNKWTKKSIFEYYMNSIANLNSPGRHLEVVRVGLGPVVAWRLKKVGILVVVAGIVGCDE